MFFGQGFDTSSLHSNLGLNTIDYSYQDNYGSNQIFSGNTLTLVVNQLPQPTPAALSYVFANLDPSSTTMTATSPSTYFDAFFPFLAASEDS